MHEDHKQAKSLANNQTKPTSVPLPFTLTGKVIQGKQLGTRLGFPTANIRYDAHRSAWPAEGVYAGIACVQDELFLCILNQGKHPTSPEGVPTVEAHLLDYPGGPLYGEIITLEYLHYLRPEQTFPSLEALTEQLSRDKHSARQWAAAYPSLSDQLIRKERS